MSDPVVSVVIPCYRHGPFLTEAVESALRLGEEEPVEILVVDDGSPDSETAAVLEALEGRGGVTVIRQENAGPAAARNRGIASSRGQFILPLDADDRLRPGVLRLAVPVLRDEPEIGIVCGRAWRFGIEEGLQPLPPYSFPEVLLDPSIHATALFRKSDWEAVGGYCEAMRSGWEDFDFWLSLIERGAGVRQFDEVFFDYRCLETSRDREHTARRDRILDTFIALFERHRDLYCEQIRILFEAHLDRREWWNEQPLAAVPRVIPEWKSRHGEPIEGPLVASGGDEVEAVVGPIPQALDRLRFHPYEGPCRVWIASITLEGGDGATIRTVSADSVVELSLAERQADGSWLFLDQDPRLAIQVNPVLEEPGGYVRIRYRVESIRKELRTVFSALTRAGFAVEALGAALRDSRAMEAYHRELSESRAAHISRLEGYLADEISRRRGAEAMSFSRFGRTVLRFFGKRFPGRPFAGESVKARSFDPEWNVALDPISLTLRITRSGEQPETPGEWREFRLRRHHRTLPLRLTSDGTWEVTPTGFPLPARLEYLRPGAAWKVIGAVQPK